MSDRTVIGTATSRDGQTVTLAKTVHASPPFPGSDQTEFYSAETNGFSAGFASRDDLLRYLTSDATEEYTAAGATMQLAGLGATGIHLDEAAPSAPAAAEPAPSGTEPAAEGADVGQIPQPEGV